MKSIIQFSLRLGCLVALLGNGVNSFAEGAAKDTIALRGEFFCGVERRLALPYSGVITELNVNVGQFVKKGDRLLKYDPDSIAKTELSKMASPAALSTAEAECAAIEDETLLAEAAAREMERLAGQDLATAQQLDQARRKAGVLQVRLKAARQRADLERQQFENNVQRLAELAEPRDKDGILNGSFVIKAPLDGVVIWVSSELQPGAAADAGAPALKLGVMDPMILRAHVHELEAVKLKAGDKAEIHPLALPNLSLSGTLSRLAWSPVAHNLPEPSYFEMEIVVPNPDRVLHQGYKADILFNKTN